MRTVTAPGTEFSRMKRRLRTSRLWRGNWRILLLLRMTRRLVLVVKAAWSVMERPGQEKVLLPRESELCFWTGWLSGVQELCWEEE